MDGPVVFKKRANKANLRKAPPPPRSSSDSDSGSDNEGVRAVKRRKTGGISNASAQRSKNGIEGATKFSADTSAKIETFDEATKQSNWYDEKAPDALSAQSLLGTTRQRETNEDESVPGIYKGQKSYGSFIQKNPDAAQKKVGPVKAPTNVRVVTQIDYAPDVCKDYKQTGFCGFGDSCKFLHAREDYAQGWKLDRDWEISTKGKKLGGTTVASANRTAKLDSDEDEEENKLLEKIPFACVICKKAYNHPVVTNCGHYFCESCALQRFRKNPSCAICGAGTGGRFNEAKNLKKLLDKKRERARKRKEKAREAGEDVSGDDEGKEDGK